MITTRTRNKIAREAILTGLAFLVSGVAVYETSPWVLRLFALSDKMSPGILAAFAIVLGLVPPVVFGYYGGFSRYYLHQRRRSTVDSETIQMGLALGISIGLLMSLAACLIIALVAMLHRHFVAGTVFSIAVGVLAYFFWRQCRTVKQRLAESITPTDAASAKGPVCGLFLITTRLLSAGFVTACLVLFGAFLALVIHRVLVGSFIFILGLVSILLVLRLADDIRRRFDIPEYI
jgi:uncharacterized membrane protein YidH (DUF202 family)